MVMTILEAHVHPEKWAVLEEAYSEGAAVLPPPIAQTFLVQSADDPTMWRITTLWRSREGLEEYRQSVETPAGVLMFRAAGGEPILSIFDVRFHAKE
jgi:hypothetical protein